MRRNLSGSGLALLCALAVHPVGAQSPPENAKSAEDIRACSRANLPEKTMVQTMLLQPTSRAGKTREIESIFLLKRFAEEETRATLQVRSPLDLSGVSYLWVDTGDTDRLLLYLPSLQRVRRVTGKTAANSLLGSDFSYEDVKYLRGVSAGGELTKLDDGEINSRPVYMLQLQPAPSDESVYRRVLFYIDQATCVPLEIELFEAGDTPRKRLVAEPDSLEQLGERWIARRMTMHDLHKHTETLLEITKIEFDEHINGAVFNQRGFYLGAYTQ